MEGSIVFYTYGSTLELYGQQFTAGMLTADLLNLSPDEYRPMLSLVHISDDQVIFVAECINALRGRDHSHLVFPQIIDEQCGLGPMAAKPGQVFYDDSVDHISVYSRRELVQPTAVKTHAAYVAVSYTHLPACPSATALSRPWIPPYSKPKPCGRVF